MTYYYGKYLRKLKIFYVRYRSNNWNIGTILIIFLFILAVRFLNNNNTGSNISDFRSGLTQEKSNLQLKLKQAEEIWQKSVQLRKEYIQSQGGISKVKPWGITEMVYYWDYFTPSFTCPHLMERVGRIGDGGKWVCGFEQFEKHNKGPQNCIVYSFGVGNESSFEAEFLKRTNCKIYAFDYTVNKLGPQISKESNSRVSFHQIGLSPKDTNETFLTLGQIMRNNGHTWIDILKIDIEGHEFPCMKQITEEFTILPFGQLQMEIHVDHFGRGFKSVYKWWTKLEKVGLRPFMSEVNHHSCVGDRTNPVAVEYSFLNIKGNHLLIS